MSALAERFHETLTRDPSRTQEALRALEQHALSDPYLQTTVHSPLLARPAFLAAAERDRLEADVTSLVDLLLELPDRLFDGEIARLGHMTGLDPAQLAAVQATWRDREVVLARADLLRGREGFKALEVNVHSSLGGIDSGPWHRAYLREPAFRDFVAAERLTYFDPMEGVARTLRAAADRRGLGERPTVAIVDWPSTFPIFADRLHRVACLLEDHGFTAFACHAGELSLNGDRLTCAGREIDILYRIFLLGDIPEAPHLLNPILEAHRRGTLLMAMSFVAELVGNKAALALLSAAADDGSLTVDERALVHRLVPWTRLTRPGTTVWRDEAIGLHALAVRERERLVLKPADGHAARGVLIGAVTPPDQWRAALTGAMGAFWVLQEQVAPVSELMPRADRVGLSFEEFDINWGVFVLGGRYGGAMLRAMPTARGQLISASHGASVGCCFSQQ